MVLSYTITISVDLAPVLGDSQCEFLTLNEAATQAASWTSLGQHIIYAQHKNKALGHSDLYAITNISCLVPTVILLIQRLSPAEGILRI